jgi:hypothetical protein
MRSPPTKYWFIIPTGLLVLAVFPMPYAYYDFLRVAVTGAAAYVALRMMQLDQRNIAIPFGVIAVLFNPIVPIYLSKQVWITFDLMAALIFIGVWKEAKVFGHHGIDD